MEKLKLGIIGTGHLGKLHIKISKTIPECELIGIFDMDAERAHECGNEFNVNVFESLDEILEKSDAVSIVATTSAHYELAKRALEAGKHVFVEKPITRLISEAEELVNIAAKKSLNLQVGHIERFNPALLSLDHYKLEPKFIQSDRLAQFNPRGTDVAVVLDLMIHDIDIILSLVKSDIKQVHASGVAVVSDNIDIANARLEFENGAVANVTASRISQKRMRKMRMFQRDSYISLDFNTGVSEVYRLISKEQTVDNHFISFGEIGVGEKKKQVIYEQPEVREVNALQYELKLFIDSVLEHTKPVVSGLDGLKALRVAEAIIKEIERSQLR
ncbi:MAG: Gfo/Idh/MocA family oxidoreductase [Ignavibacteria bacterium]|jgi:predicted dehydrogenase|nr:Gfo/Idh/MocA family oxidoreductase [Ignavibacteria bacterium]MCU7502429.1 Gfo/Idh/MocA family oxidoreductase [Ignavibacteria bacterium]MCU7515006.1 Gfo/Idh/MocA family oxidoreductase [Ignavibacteria bacterium]